MERPTWREREHEANMERAIYRYRMLSYVRMYICTNRKEQERAIEK